MKLRNLSNRFLPQTSSFVGALILCQFASQASAVTYTWDGGATAGNTTFLNNSSNWDPTGLPGAGDIGQFNGTVAGNLLLGVNGPSAGANPWSVSVTAAQDSSVTLDPPTDTGKPIRLYNITIEEGAFETAGAAFSLGNGTGTPYIYLGNNTAPYTSNLFTNNSAATALIQADVRFGNGAASTASRILTFDGTGNWNVTAPVGINAGTATGSLGLVKNGAGALSLGGANTFTDGLVMNQGTLNLNSTAALGAAGSTFTLNGGLLDNTSGAAKVVGNSVPVILNTDVTFSTAASTGVNDLSLGSGTVSLGTTAGTSRTFNTLGSAVLTLSGVVSNGTTINSIIKQGTGGLKLDANNTYSGGTALTAGILHIGGNGALGTGTVTVTGGGFVARVAGRTIPNSISLAADFIIGQPLVANQMNFSGAINLGGVNRTVNLTDTTQATESTLSGVISNGGLTKIGGGNLLLTGVNTFAGPTTVTAGTLTLNNAHPIDSSSAVAINGTDAKLIVRSGGALSTDVTLPQPVTLTQGAIDGDGNISSLTIADNIVNTISAGNGQQVPLNIGSLTFQGAATLNLTKTNASGQELYVTDLVTSPTADVVVNVTSSTGVWADNTDYYLIEYANSYASAPDASHFTLTPPVGLNPSQHATLVKVDGAIVLRITTDAITWTGLVDSNWTNVTTPGAPKNWYENGNDVAFTDLKSALFDGSASSYDVNIAANVNPSSTIITNDFSDYTFSSTGAFGISGGSLTKNGAAKATINTTNTYNGTTRVTGGILEIKGSIANTSAITIGTGATLAFEPAAASNVYAAPVASSGNITKNGTSSLTLSGAISGTGGLTVNEGTVNLSGAKTGTGALTLNGGILNLSGANTGTGGVTLNAGTLNIAAASALGAATGTLVINGGVLDNTSGGALAVTGAKPQTWNGDFTFTGSNNLDLGTTLVTLGGSGDRVVTFAGAGDILTVGEIRTPLLGTQGLTLTGGGTLVATSTGAFADASQIGGTLTVDAGTTLQINRATADAAGTGDFTAAGLAGTGTIINGALATERSFRVSNTTDNTFAGTIADGGAGLLSLNKQGTGTLTLTGASTYTGPTVIGTGIINARHNNALGASRVRILSLTAGLQLQGGITLPPTVTFLTSNDGSSGIGYAIDNVSGDNTITGTITMTQGAGATLVRSDSGSLTLAGNISSDQARSLLLHGVSTGANTVSGVLSNGTSGTNGLTKSGTGLWILTGTNTYTGVTTISEGTLQLGNGTTDGTIGTSSSVVNNASLVYNWTTDHTAGYVISGTGSVTKNGAGVATLTGVNTYTGTTTVNAGELAVTGSSIVDTGTVVINGGKVNVTGTEIVNQLFFGGVQQPAGVYTAANSGTQFSGSGNFVVTSGPGGASGFNTWASANGATGQTASDDHDSDGVANGVEFFVGATGTGFTALPSVVVNAGVRTVTWPKSASFTGSYEVQISSDLGTWTAAPGGTVIDNGSTVVFTFPAGPTVRFVRLTVNPS